ncbi:MAG: thioredoxin domain-containing protein [Myxococcales bacterium]|nr:thioredoxin domain-containing protein [Myxococcales bacterium]
MDRFRITPLILLALITIGATCNRNKDETGENPSSSASAPKIELAGVDTGSLTAREHQIWSDFVSELLAPCPEVAVSVAQCVTDERDCKLCLPAAQFLLRQVQSGRPKADVKEIYEARFDPKQVKTIVLGDSPAKGPDDPAVTFVEFADFECPACGAVYPLVEELYAKYGKNMKVVFKAFPLAIHPNAKLAAQAAFAAGRQGHFWKMHKMLFENQLRLTEPDLVEYAEEIGLDVNRFKKDLHSDDAIAAVDKEKAQGESLGVSGTPSIYINGRGVDLSKLGNPVKDLEEWIELELTIAGKGKSDGGVKAPGEGDEKKEGVEEGEDGAKKGDEGAPDEGTHPAKGGEPKQGG